MLRKRTKVMSAIALALGIVLLLSLSMSVVYATTPIPISGSINITGATFQVDRKGESNISVTEISLGGFFVGGIAGPYISESRWVNHNVETPLELWRNVHAVDTISPATVMGKTGTLYFMLDSSGPGGGSWVIIGGTDDLAGLHGRGTTSPGGGGVVNFEGQIHFDP